jgi:hypothetical protein
VPVSAADGNGDSLDNVHDNQPLVAIPGHQDTDSHYTSVSSNALLSVTTVSPATVNIGRSRFSLTVNGASFSSESVVQWNGENKTTYFLLPARLKARIRAADVASVGTYAVTVFTPGLDGGLPNGVNATVKAVQKITSIRPYEKKAGSPPFLMPVIGLRFIPGSRVMWNPDHPLYVEDLAAGRDQGRRCCGHGLVPGEREAPGYLRRHIECQDVRCLPLRVLTETGDDFRVS